jgi:hypothetical protein
VTDSGADPDFLDEFRSSGNEVVVVPVSDEQDPSGDA